MKISKFLSENLSFVFGGKIFSILNRRVFVMLNDKRKDKVLFYAYPKKWLIRSSLCAVKRKLR